MGIRKFLENHFGDVKYSNGSKACNAFRACDMFDSQDD